MQILPYVTYTNGERGTPKITGTITNDKLGKK
jgi:hypothetical protein